MGCGAIGSLFAAHLAHGGEVEVYAFDVSQQHVDAINRDGLRLSGAADLHVRLAKASTDPAELPLCDYGIVATKAIHTRAARSTRRRACFDDSSAVCSVQNGVGNEEIIAEHVKYVIRGTTFPAGHVIEPGHVGFDIKGDTWIGPFEPTAHADGSGSRNWPGSSRARGMNTIAMADARGAQWTKLIFNAATNPVGALTRLHHGAATRFPPTGELFEALIEEGKAVAKAMGIELHGDPTGSGGEGRERSGQAQGQHVAGRAGAARMTEVDFMNGAIVKWGEKTGVPTPLNRAMWALIKGLEHSWTEP